MRDPAHRAGTVLELNYDSQINVYTLQRTKVKNGRYVHHPKSMPQLVKPFNYAQDASI